MIINTDIGNIEVIGDVKEFKSSIDPKNLEFITTLLSSNLYSNPEASFIREIVSNAWDSHVEAETTNVPVLISFKDNRVTIRDFGTGLSPERFNEIYRNIGSSTKRESNDFIGCFGIGHLSPFACSNTVYITSYYNGKAYFYIGNKVNNSITYHQLNIADTNEKNGVEVSIKTDSIRKYVEATKNVVFFPNIYLDHDPLSINLTKTKRFKNFAVCSMPIENKLLLGNVLYPCHTSQLSDEARIFIESLESTGAALSFDIGELDITPNRENLIYNSRTIDTINKRAIAAKEELISLIKPHIKKDYDDIVEYSNICETTLSYDAFTDKVHLGYLYPFIKVFSNDLEEIFTYKGKEYSKNERTIIGRLRSTSIPYFRGFVCEGKIYIKRIPYNKRYRNNLETDKIVILSEKTTLTEVVQAYLKRCYDNYTLISDVSLDTYKDIITALYPNTDKTLLEKFIEIFYNRIKSKAVYLDSATNQKFQDFRKEYLESKKSLRKVNPILEKEVTLYLWDNTVRRSIRVFRNFNEAVKLIKNLKSKVTFGEYKDDRSYIPVMTYPNDILYIQAKRDVIKELKNTHITNAIDLEWLLSKWPLIKKVNTIKSFEFNVSDISYLYKAIPYMPSHLRNDFSEIVTLYSKFCTNYSWSRFLKDKDPGYDPYTMYICNEAVRYISKYRDIGRLVEDELGLCKQDFTAWALMKSKAFRIDGRVYLKMKKNPLIKLLCKK